MNTTSLALFYKSLSEPVRLRIVNLLLQREELCVCDIITTLALPQSVVSRHLAYLKKGAIVTSRRQGKWQYYALSLMTPAHPLHCFLISLRQTFEQCADCAQDVARLHPTINFCLKTTPETLLIQGDQ